VRALAFSANAASKLLVGTESGLLAIHDAGTGRVIGSPVPVGYTVHRTGWNDHRIWALLASGQLLHLDSGLRPTALLTIDLRKGVLTTPEGWYSGDDSFVRVYRNATNKIARKSIAAQMYSPTRVIAAVTGRGTIWRQVSGSLETLWLRARRWIRAREWWEILGVLAGVPYGVIVTLVFVIWLVRPHILAHWAMVPFATPNVPPLKRLASVLSVTNYLGHTTRALEKWLARSGPELEARFNDADKVRSRSRDDGHRDGQAMTRYIDLGNDNDIAVWRDSVSEGTPAAVWITGPGGCGKTTLAIQLARIARTVGLRRPFPILIDADWRGDLVDAVAAALTIGRKRLTRAMVERLADHGLICPIVDGMSERRVADAETQFLSAAVFRLRIATSRMPPPAASPVRPVVVGPLTPDRLRSFVDAYTSPDVAAAAFHDVSLLAGDEAIRPLFARLALDRWARGANLPNSYPALVQDYVLGLAPGGASAIRNDDFLRAARITALACVEEDFAPHPISMEMLRGSLRVSAQRLPFEREQLPGDPLNDVEVIDQMRVSGLVDTVMSLGVTQLRFAFDPIAEYLAAMEISAGGEAYAALRERIERSDSALKDALWRVDSVRRAP
jgi:hypothetical protein